MSGMIKAGLLFGLIGLLITIAFSFVPYLGVLCCGPIAALLLGGGAAYLGSKWETGEPKIARGLLAGGMAGFGSMLGSIIFFVAVIAFIGSMPEFDQMVRDMLEQQAPGSNLSTEQLRTMISVTGPIAGACVGTFGLLFGLAGGALGSWLFMRQRRQMPPTTIVSP